MSERTGDPVEVLLVEDNPGDVRLTEEAFKQGGLANTLHVVNDGVAAMEFLRGEGEYEEQPTTDIVLLDLNLPRKNGEEVLEEIRTDEDLQSLPVIVLTSSKAEEDVVQSYDLCANAYLTKPVDPDDFIETIRTFGEFWLEVVRLPPEDGR
jgi:CheY-like chemotaxis protein